ncbi:MAG: hypothetical protein LBD67_08065 [Candidatus Accumulibacter sp.]|jgi:uncharacterized membrane protein YhaH (DUF805 family)|nr:hypothetical protein [Accumulibacter sp.]
MIVFYALHRLQAHEDQIRSWLNISFSSEWYDTFDFFGWEQVYIDIIFPLSFTPFIALSARRLHDSSCSRWCGKLIWGGLCFYFFCPNILLSPLVFSTPLYLLFVIIIFSCSSVEDTPYGIKPVNVFTTLPEIQMRPRVHDVFFVFFSMLLLWLFWLMASCFSWWVFSEQTEPPRPFLSPNKQKNVVFNDEKFYLFQSGKQEELLLRKVDR